VWAPSDKGHIRLDKGVMARLARIFPQCALVWMILHIITETSAAVEPRPEWADIDKESWRERLGIADRTREKYERILERKGILFREHADLGHNRGGYKVDISPDHLERIPIKAPRPCKPAPAAQRAPDQMAAYQQKAGAHDHALRQQGHLILDVTDIVSGVKPESQEAALAAARKAAEAAILPFLEPGAHDRALQPGAHVQPLAAEASFQSVPNEAQAQPLRDERQVEGMRAAPHARAIPAPERAGGAPDTRLLRPISAL